MGGGASKKSAIAEDARKKLGGSGSETSVVMKLTEHQLDEFRECFNAFDKDGGGSIDSNELGAPLSNMSRARCFSSKRGVSV